MGLAELLSTEGDGKYSIKILFDMAAVDLEIAELTVKIDLMYIKIADLETDLAAAEAEFDTLATAVDAAIAAYSADPTKDNYKAMQLAGNDLALQRLEVDKQKSGLNSHNAAILSAELRRGNLSNEARDETRDVWFPQCLCDITNQSSISHNDQIGIVEIGDQYKKWVNITPDIVYETSMGKIQPTASMKAAEMYYNAAMLPGTEKWKPGYRKAVITALNADGTLATVRYDKCISEAKPALESLAMGSSELNINQSEVSESLDVGWIYLRVAQHRGALRASRRVFQVGDRVLVEFLGRNWNTPRIAGFSERPMLSELPNIQAFFWTVGIDAWGQLYGAGDNDYGELDFPQTKQHYSRIDTGRLFTLVQKAANGAIVGYGDNTYGQITDAEAWSDTIVQIACGYNFAIGLTDEARCVYAGSNSDGQCNVGLWTGIMAIAAGTIRSLGLQSDGTLIQAGFPANRPKGTPWATWVDVVDFAASFSAHTLVGIKSDGTCYANALSDLNYPPPWGTGEGIAEIESNWSDIVAVSAGDAHVLGLKSNGSVVGVGWDGHGEVSEAILWSDIVAIAAGAEYSVGIDSYGNVFSCGFPGTHLPVGWNLGSRPESAL